MNIREPSQHLDRDKKPEDPLENILEPWGVWRQWGVEGLSSARKSPIVDINQLEKRNTDHYDLLRYVEIRDTLIRQGVDKRNLKAMANQEWKEWKARIRGLNVPRETCETRPKDPKYGGHKYYSKIDRILSTLYGPYYNILIRKYEDLWDIKEFVTHHRIDANLARVRLFKARQAARKILKKNGYKT